MAYLKFSRDKRGYEHFYLVQPANRGKGRPRVLYWFRTPPGVKVGRTPFDADMRRVLEAQNPDVAFDWEAISHTPIPPPAEAERWRERRRVERAFRAASAAEESAEIAEAMERPELSDVVTVDAADEPSVGEVEELYGGPGGATDAVVPATVTAQNDAAPQDSAAPEADAAPQANIAPQANAAPQGPRRRRRRRGRRKAQVSAPQTPAVQDSGEPEDENSEP